MKRPGNGDLGTEFQRTAAPIYRDVTTVLERRIRSGAWKPGDQIPTEAQLEREFSTSRGTLRKAIYELVRLGLLHPQPGRGTFVTGPSFQSLERFFRYEGLDASAPLTPDNKVLKRGVRVADAAIATALGIERRAKVGYVRRLRMQKGEPFLLIDSYFHMDAWRRIETDDFAGYPLYDVFKDRHGLYIVSADEYLQAGIVSAAEATLLRIPARSAVIRLKRTACTFENQPVEFRLATGRGDRFRYHVRLE